MSETHKLIYATKKEDGPGPNFIEVMFEGGFIAAVTQIVDLAASAKAFILGQVLAQDGKVLATVAPQGIVHFTE